jgi:hypothetical protein
MTVAGRDCPRGSAAGRNIFPVWRGWSSAERVRASWCQRRAISGTARTVARMCYFSVGWTGFTGQRADAARCNWDTISARSEGITRTDTSTG